MRDFVGDKKGETLLYTVILLVVVLVFFFPLMAFAYKSSTGSLVYEEAYAKKISLILDKARPGTEILIDFREGFEIAKDNDFNGKLLRIDTKDNRVIVSLSNQGGYSSNYITNYAIEKKEFPDKNKIRIIVKDGK